MSGERPPRERMRRAIRAVRREGRKAAAVHAVADGMVVLLAVNLGLDLVGSALPAVLVGSVPLPGAVGAGLPGAVDTSALAAVAVGATAIAVSYLVGVRRPAVERFEAVNPLVAEALRTARDVLAADREGALADRLYESVLERLRGCSSLGLVDVRRLVATVALVVLLGAANVQVAVVDLDLVGPATPEASAGGPPPSGSEDEYGGLRNPDEVLGEPEDVSAGDESMNATLPTRGSGNGSESAASYATGGFSSDGAVESQRAGFAERERLEDAELIREYNLRIREDDDS